MRSWFLSSHTAKNNSVAKEEGPGFHRLAPDLQILALFYRHSEVRGGTGTTFFLN